MHKDFYASGFLYHPKTQQILLQQENTENNSNTWTLLGGGSSNEEDIKESFLKILTQNLNIQLKPKSIYSVYDYIDKDKNIFIFYATVKKLEKFSHKTKTFSWFTLKQIQKLSISEQAKQDIIVGQRVIDSSIRKDLGLQTIG